MRFFIFLILMLSSQAYGMIHVKRCIEETEAQFGIPRTLLAAVIEHESSYNIKAINKVGRDNAVASYGLGQITIPTARSYCGIRSRKELMSYQKNIKCTAKILRHHLIKYGNIHSALTAYRAGSPCKQTDEETIRVCTTEDNKYIKGVLRKMRLKFNI